MYLEAVNIVSNNVILLSWSKVLIFQIYICFLNLCLVWETISSQVSYVHVPYILYIEHKLSIVNVRTFINANFKSVSVNILLLTRRGISLCISMILKKHKFFTHDEMVIRRSRDLRFSSCFNVKLIDLYLLMHSNWAT